MTERYLKSPRINVRDRARAFEAKHTDGPKPTSKKASGVDPPNGGTPIPKNAAAVTLHDTTEKVSVVEENPTVKREVGAPNKGAVTRGDHVDNGKVEHETKKKGEVLPVGVTAELDLATRGGIVEDLKAKGNDVRDANSTEGGGDTNMEAGHASTKTTVKSGIAKSGKVRVESTKISTLNATSHSRRKESDIGQKANQVGAGETKSAEERDLDKKSGVEVECHEAASSRLVAVVVTESQASTTDAATNCSDTVASIAKSSEVKSDVHEVSAKSGDGTPAVGEDTKKAKKVKSARSKPRPKDGAGVQQESPLVYDPTSHEAVKNQEGCEPEHGGCIRLHNTEELVKQFNRMVAPPGGVLHAKSTSLDSGLAEITNIIDEDDSFGRLRRSNRAGASSTEKRTATYVKYLQAIGKGKSNSGRRGSESAVECESRDGTEGSVMHVLERSSSNSGIWEQCVGDPWGLDSDRGLTKHQVEQRTKASAVQGQANKKDPRGPKRSSEQVVRSDLLGQQLARGSKQEPESSPGTKGGFRQQEKGWRKDATRNLPSESDHDGTTNSCEQVPVPERNSGARCKIDPSVSFAGGITEHSGGSLQSGSGSGSARSLDKGQSSAHDRQGPSPTSDPAHVLEPEPNTNGRFAGARWEEAPAVHAPAVANLKAGQDARAILGSQQRGGPPSPSDCCQRLQSGGTDWAAEKRLRHYYGEDGGLEQTSQIAQLLTSVQKIREEFERCAWEQQDEPFPDRPPSPTGRRQTGPECDSDDDEVVIGLGKFQDGENLATDAVAVVAKEESRACCGEQRERGKNSCGSVNAASSLTRQNRSRRNRLADVSSAKAELATNAEEEGPYHGWDGRGRPPPQPTDQAWNARSWSGHADGSGVARCRVTEDDLGQRLNRAQHDWYCGQDSGGPAETRHRDADCGDRRPFTYTTCASDTQKDQCVGHHQVAAAAGFRSGPTTKECDFVDAFQRYGALHAGAASGRPSTPEPFRSGRQVGLDGRGASAADTSANWPVLDTVNKVDRGTRGPRSVPDTVLVPGESRYHQVSPQPSVDDGRAGELDRATGARAAGSGREDSNCGASARECRRERLDGRDGRRCDARGEVKTDRVWNLEDDGDLVCQAPSRTTGVDFTFEDERPLHSADDGRMERKLCSLSAGDRPINSQSHNLARACGAVTPAPLTLHRLEAHPSPSPTNRTSPWSCSGVGSATVSSPGSPLSCISKIPVRSKPSLPAYLTARRNRPTLDRVGSDPERRIATDGDRAERDAIESILGELDFGKFRRGTAAPNSKTVLRSALHQPAVPEKTHDEKLRELRELTEKLKPAIRRAKLESDSPTSAIPVNPPSGLWRDDDSARRPGQARFRRPVFRSASVPQVDDLRADDVLPHLWEANDPPARYDGVTTSFPVSPFATLPRRREPYRGQNSGTDGLASWAPLGDSDAVTDEGLVADSDLAVSNYAQEYRNVTSVSAPATPGARHRTFSDMPNSRGFDFQVKAALAELRGTTAALQYTSLDRRKRRKGVGFDVGNGAGYEMAPSKTGNGRSLTYPPQRRSSVTEGMEYTSVDSNGLRSYGAAMMPDHVTDQNLAHPARDHLNYPSELSLADSHLSTGDSHYNATYGDVLKSVTADADDGTGTGSNGKLLKKKHYSDPSGEKNGEGLLDLPEFMTCSKSEPQLPSNGGATSVSTLAIPYDRSAGILRAAVSSPVTFDHLERTPSFGSSEGGATPTTPLLERRDSKSPQQQRRYSKKRLRGPYGEMLEEEMRKSGEKQMLQQKSTIAEELSFLNDLMEPKVAPSGDRSDCPTSPMPTPFHVSCRSLDETALRVASERAHGNSNNGGYRRKVSANLPLVVGDEELDGSPPLYPASSAPSFLGRAPKEDQPWNLCEELDAEGEDLESLLRRHQDTRTHVVAELYDTEKSYVESLQILVNKYFRPLKSPEYCTLVDATLVDEMFFQVPEILAHHEAFLDSLKQRLENWDNKQKVGDVFGESFTKQQVIDTYTAFINNWKAAKEAIKVAMQAKPAFTKFLEHMSREHKGKLTLDDLLIMPVQRIPRYELLIKELLKHTQVDHPDHRLLLIAQKEVHDLAIKINHMEREAYEAEQMQLKLREMESMIEGLVDLVHPLRMFLRYDLVTMSGSLGTKKERCLFFFSDLLIITSIKRKSGTIRRTASSLSSPGSLSNLLEMNKYKLLMRISLDDLDVARTNDAHIKKALKDIGQLEEDAAILNRMSELAATLNVPHQNLDELLKELLSTVSKQLQEKQMSDGQLLCLELTVTTQVGMETMSINFSAPDKRSSWEAAFHEAKQKLALSTDRRPPPEFMYPLPIRKTRAGLQFTCAAPTLGVSAPHRQLRDVWVCNSDGYVGQVCVLSLEPEPTVASCNGATAECLAAHRRSTYMDSKAGVSIAIEDVDEEDEENAALSAANGNIQLDSDSSEEEKEPSSECQDEDGVQRKGETSPDVADDVRTDDMDNRQPTMWLGTEDGCIHVYNCNDNIRIKKNKVKLQHSAAIHCITHFDGKVFVALANGDLAIYRRDPAGGWDTNEPTVVSVGNSVTPIVRMIAVTDKLWCGCQNVIKVIDIASLEIENSFAVNPDTNRPVQCMVTLGLGVWVSVQNSAIIKLYHATSYEMVLEVNVAPAVAKMLAAGCDDIIRQHKAACLRVTSLLACKDLLWIGTSAGVVLNLALPHLTSTTTKLTNVPNVSGIPHGHTGHVRFLTCVEMTPPQDTSGRSKYTHRSLKYKDGHTVGRRSSTSALGSNRLLVISGGDGYEDFRNTNYSEAAGRDDSTNHLLLWQV